MRKLTSLLLLLIPVCAGAAPSLVPMPREMRMTDARTTMAAPWVIVPSPDPADAHAAAMLRDEAREALKQEWSVAASAAPGGSVIQFVATAPAPEDPPLYASQGYTLEIEPARITIGAPTAQGRFYGAQTLRQLLRTAPRGGAIARGVIRDWPALEWRGVSDDISRGQVSTVEDFRAIIRDLAYFKKNLYQPYIEDMFEFDASPNAGRKRGAITKAEMALIVEEGRLNHVTVCPVFETLGHQDRLLGLPENRRFAEIQGGDEKPWSFSPVLPGARAFVKRLVDEMAAATPNPFFHIGGDESSDVGKGTARAAVKKIGVGRVHARYFSEIADHVREKYGRRTLMYGDMLLAHPDALAELPKDAVIVDWHYQPDTTYPSVAKLKAAGIRNFMVSPGLWSWATFYPAYHKGFASVRTFAEVGKREGAMGCITSSWGDWGAENLRENNIVGYAFSGAACWEPSSPGDDEFLVRYCAVRYGSSAPDLVAAEKLAGWQQFPELTYYHPLYHRIPKITERDSARLQRLDQLRADMVQGRKTIAAARKKARFNRDHLDSLDHAARRFLFIAERDLALTRIARDIGSTSTAALSPGKRAEIRATIARLRDQSQAISADFERLWLRRNKYPMLGDNMTRLQKQTADLQEMVVRAESGELVAAPPARGTFIWHDDAGLDPVTSTTTGTRYFVRVVNVEKDVASATLRFWADDRGKAYLNGRKVADGAYANPVTEAAASATKLVPGRNILAFQAENEYGAGAALIVLDIRHRDGSSVTVTGDDQWRSSAAESPGWNNRPATGPAWKPVRVIGNAPMEPWDTVEW